MHSQSPAEAGSRSAQSHRCGIWEADRGVSLSNSSNYSLWTPSSALVIKRGGIPSTIKSEWVTGRREQVDLIYILHVDFPHVPNFSCLCEQISDRKQLSGGGVYFGLRFEGIQSIMAGMQARHQERQLVTLLLCCGQKAEKRTGPGL